MIWKPREEEIFAVLLLRPAERYKYFIKKVVDEGQLCGLWNDGWAIASDDMGDQLMPVWPHANYADRCAFDQWNSFSPKIISLDTWLERWTPGLISDGRLIAVFPTPQNTGISINAYKLNIDLMHESQNYT